MNHIRSKILYKYTILQNYIKWEINSIYQQFISIEIVKLYQTNLEK